MKFKFSVRNVILALLILGLVALLISWFLRDPELFITQVINGLSQGAIFALVAIGYTMVYGIIELVNFAHGDVYMIGAMLSLTIASLLRASEESGPLYNLMAVLLMFLTAPVVCALLNVTIERFAYRPLRNSSRLAALITAIGVSFILEQVGLFWATLPSNPFIYFGGSGSVSKGFPALVSKANILADTGLAINLTPKHLFALALAIPLMIALTVFVRRTRTGKAMRATAQNRDAARLMGIDIDRIISMTFLIGGALAGVGGVAGGLYYEGVVWNMGFDMGLKAFTAAVLGGIGNITGAVMGGFFIGLISALSDQYLAGQWTRAVVFAVLVLVLVFRPSGFLGTTVTQKA
ncbi:MAG: High-affinity branched-chain amino acid transport system permease protein LivH [Anaerolineae bacterium]|nr:High-affinity branched-chain amino acid transport system permease protein LivH [Anaerolineae bacterium]RIK34304.1 MAG: branched-chain amino acid ABC transporter permease [Chloroflexota bacterium]